MLESGVYDRLLRRYQPKEKCSGYETRDSQQTISLDTIANAFYLLAYGLSLSCLCLVVEVCFRPKTTHSTANDQQTRSLSILKQSLSKRYFSPYEDIDRLT